MIAHTVVSIDFCRAANCEACSFTGVMHASKPSCVLPSRMGFTQVVTLMLLPSKTCDFFPKPRWSRPLESY
jgi:hypothetical protein